jgi:hypothetical protein
MNKAVIFLAISMMIIACKTKPYFNHKMKFKRIADNCTGIDENVSMNSNINGERYTINKCLDAGFDDSRFFIGRQGDTILIRFEDKGGVRNMFEFTVDVDTYPRYNFLSLDGNVTAIVPASPN